MVDSVWLFAEKKFKTKFYDDESKLFFCKILNLNKLDLSIDDIKKLSPTFKQKIYVALLAVPKGKVTTYKELANRVGSKAYRAIGQFMNKNPFAPSVPCHRVISSDGSLGGFASGLDKKKVLLKKEGVVILNDKIDKMFFYNHNN
ncbi:MGMT family protein [Candidatus Woesearchaeota archaeon]|nr:MGMT family protein [Candidatus Woesearchaeota archaeon]MCF7900707.1 MGMT family protein [Candidatus Woesearchaeota archaeon]MCF8013228.1 MGMT family protein [Candidatus Woesearchaeota archaeon]